MIQLTFQISYSYKTIGILNAAKNRLKEEQEKSPDEGNRVSRIRLHDEIIDKILAELK